MRKFLLLIITSAAFGQQTLHLTLEDAEKLATKNNPRISSAKFTAAAAYQVPTELHSAYEPTFSANLTGVGADGGTRIAAGGLNNPVVYNRFGSGVSVNQMITDFGRTGNLVASAKLHAAAQDQTTEATRSQVLLATDRAYFSVLRAQVIQQVAEQTVKARQLVVDQVTALADSKLKSSLDVSFANVNLADARLLLVQAQSDVKAAQADLAAAMGLPNDTNFTVEEHPMPDPLPSQLEPFLRDAMRDRPELANLRLEESAAKRYAQAENALKMPSIGVIGSAGFVPAGEATVPGRFGALALNVSIPVFNGGLYKARHTEAEMKARAAKENISDQENRIIRDVRVAFLNATTAYDRLALTDQLLRHAQSALDLAQTRYEYGLGTIVELSQAQLAVTSAQIAASTAKYDYQSQRSMLAYQVGALK